MLILSAISALALFCATLGHEEASHPADLGILRLPAELSRVKKREDDSPYFWQCETVNLWKGRAGYVNVVAFLDTSWQYSFRQAVMLKLLKTRLEKSGFADIWFFVVTAPIDLPEEKLVDDMEIDAWNEISAQESENLLNTAEKAIYDFSSNEESQIIYIQDTPQLRIWEHFHASKDQIVVMDRCGKMAYQVIVPWSILYYPYVKAAILSTYKEEPCGPCDIHVTSSNTSSEHADYEMQTTTVGADIAITQNSVFPDSQNLTNSNKNSEGDTTEPTIVLQSVITNPLSNKCDSIIAEVKNEKDSFSTLNSSTISTTSVHPNNEVTTVATVFIETELKNRTLPSDSVNSSINNVASTVEDEDKEANLDVSGRNPEQDTKIDSASKADAKNGEAVKEVKIAEEDSEFLLPARIIMRAPHVHWENGIMKKEEYLILKIGDPNYHRHIDSKIFPDKQEQLEPSVIMRDQDQDDKERKFIYEKDESPGLYGEVADYWRHHEDTEMTYRNQTAMFNADYDYTESIDEEERYSNSIAGYTTVVPQSDKMDEDYSTTEPKSETANENSAQKLKDENMERVNSATEKDVIDLNIKEEKIRHKLIDHYSKLLPWIYYVLHK
ncbi:hypothetical protein KM043_013442 [Ampulex compressa]|nr:hypothetical protein KM043_013442 [Ampulex compressa]